MALTTYLANKLLDHAIGKAAYTMPASFVGVATASPTASGSFTAEPTYAGYARVSTPAATWSAASAGASTNAAAINLAAKTGGTDVVITYWFTADALTGGNMLEFGPLTASLTVSNGVAPNFPVGQCPRSAA